VLYFVNIKSYYSHYFLLRRVTNVTQSDLRHLQHDSINCTIVFCASYLAEYKCVHSLNTDSVASETERLYYTLKYLQTAGLNVALIIRPFGISRCRSF
jgi:hypothetical protein